METENDWDTRTYDKNQEKIPHKNQNQILTLSLLSYA